MTSADPDRPCPHQRTEVVAQVVHLTDAGGRVEGYSVELRLGCVDCGDRFRWLGLPVGVSPLVPTSDLEGFVMRAPVVPESVPDGFGQGLPGVGLIVRPDGE